MYLKMVLNYLVPKAKKSALVCGVCWFGMAINVQAADEVLVIDGAEIRGDQEQPKILYIVPWQRPGSRGGLEPSSVDIVGAGLLKPIYREEFLREVAYFDLFHQESPEDVSTEADIAGGE
ncbi:hypothetical protein [Hahella ganghwensis]|uniref:hypothetical protein n=1 Tax=Hahella ganghwensis TaxID=286420 RepID=UPI00036102F2|nr:hypothetical protein [Hahella ganghwensis]